MGTSHFPISLTFNSKNEEYSASSDSKGTFKKPFYLGNQEEKCGRDDEDSERGKSSAIMFRKAENLRSELNQLS